MVRVANCPKCNHEAVMFDETDSDDWARCPDCRTYFQIKSVAAREVPPLVMSKDEALLADEESAAAVETVCSALETRWDDSRQTWSAASSQTIAQIESVMARAEEENNADEHRDNDVPGLEGREPADPVPAEPKPPKHLTGTVADFSMLGTWSDVPQDEQEAQARAVEAGDAPTETSDSQPLDTRHSSEASDDAIDLDQEFQFQETLANFDPVSLDGVRQSPPPNDNPLDEIEDDSEESSTDWDDPEEMVRLLTSRDETDAEDDAADDRSADESSEDSSTAATAPVSPEVLVRQTRVAWAQNRRQRSPLRSIAMIAIAGIFGLALGYYALFWIAGPNADFLNIAQYLPAQVLPPTFSTSNSFTTQSSSPAVAQDTRPPEVQASHTEPVDNEQAFDAAGDIQENPAPADTSLAAADASMPSQVASTEPLELDPPPAVPLADVPAAVETAAVDGAPTFTADQLAAALQTAGEAQAGLISGDLDGSVEEKRAKGKSYAILCDLAQKATFVDRQSQPAAAAALDQQVQELFRAALANPQTREEVARIVPMWLESPNRKHGGIFFAGAVQSQAEKGSVIECDVDLGGQRIIVIVPTSHGESLPAGAEPVAIVGWLVDRPAESVTGYAGEAPQAVWAGHIIPLQ